MTARSTRSAVAVALVIACGLTGSAYLKFGSEQGAVLHWGRQPARYYVSDRSVPGVTASDLDAAVARALATWHGVASAAISFERVGFTSSAPFEPDGVSVIGFDRRPDLERTLGATSFTYDMRTGELIEADIFLNSTFDWSVAAAGEAGRFDVQSIALHEIGHFIGLGHSALGETELRAGGGRRVIGAEAAMFPIAFSAGTTLGRTLRADDIAGVSDIYPAPGFRDDTGSVSGRVIKNGQGVYGAHVVAFSLSTGVLVGGFSFSHDGAFAIAGLPPGPAVLRAEPLDDGDPESFVSPSTDVDIDFLVAYAERTVVVSQGSAVSGVVIHVTPKQGK